MITRLLLLLLLFSPLVAEDLPNISFNRLDLEPRETYSDAPILLDHKFLEPHLDHQAFADLYLNHTELPPEEEPHSPTPNLYGFEDPIPQADQSDDRGLLAHLNLHSYEEVERILNQYQEQSLAIAHTETNEIAASTWELLMDRAVALLSRLPDPFCLEPHEMLSPFLAAESLIPEPSLYIMLMLMLLPVIVFTRTKKRQLQKL
jgi:hypothetical protein